MYTEIGALAQSLQKRCFQVPFCPLPQHHTGKVLPASACCVVPFLCFLFPHCSGQGRGGEQQRGRALAGIACVVLQVGPGRTGTCGSVNVAQCLHLSSEGNLIVEGSCLADHDHFHVTFGVSSGFFCNNWIIRKLCSVETV